MYVRAEIKSQHRGPAMSDEIHEQSETFQRLCDLAQAQDYSTLNMSCVRLNHIRSKSL